MVENYPPNSRSLRDKEPAKNEEPENEKKVEKVISGQASRRKPSLGKRFAALFIGEGADSVGDYLLKDVLVPAFKDTVTDMVSQGIERLVYGEVRGTRGPAARTAQRGGPAHIPYNRMSAPAQRREDPRRELSHAARSQHDFDEIVLDTHNDAVGVLDGLYEQLDRFQVTTVADLYDLAGLRSSYTDRNWGWTDLSGSSAVRVKGGYLLNLPRPVQLD